MADGNRLALGGGMFRRVEVIELVEASPLANGLVVCGGRLRLSEGVAAPRDWCDLELDDGRVARIWPVENGGREVTFCGRFV